MYFQVLGRGHFTPDAVRSATVAGLLVHSVYMEVANRRGYLKQLDVGVWLLLAFGAVCAYAGIEPVVALFQRYSPALLFTALGLMALVPLLLGRETFTYLYGRRNSPRWQQKLPEFHAINRLMTGFWTAIFFGAAAITLVAPTDPMFTVFHPNLLVLLVGVPAQFWMRIARGELDGSQALTEGLYRAEGDYLLLAKMPELFKAR